MAALRITAPILADNGLVDTDRVLIRDRKPEICGDFVSMNLVIADDIANVEASAYLMTHTTNPLMSPGTVSRALAAFRDGGSVPAPAPALDTATA